MLKPSLLLDKYNDTVDVGVDSDSLAAPRTQLTLDDWVRAATDLLITKSIDAVRVDVLVKQLDVTRDSFYWHFKNRDDLLHQMLQNWSERTRVGPELGRQNLSAQGLIRDLLALPFRGRSARRTAMIEFIIRAWARRGPMTQGAVEAVDKHRMDYYIQHFQTVGFMHGDAKTRIFMLHAYQLPEATLWHQDSRPDKDARRHFFENTLFTGTPRENSVTPS